MSNPRRTPVTRPDGPLALKTNMTLRKGATFHSPTSPSSCSSDVTAFHPPSLPRRSQTNLDDVVDAHRRRVALALGDIDKRLTASKDSSDTRKSFRDESLPIPQGFLDHTVATMAQDAETERRVLRPRTNRRPSRYHESDSGLGTSIATSIEKPTADVVVKKGKSSVRAITRSAAAAASNSTLPCLSAKATNRICEHTLKPLLAQPSLKTFHPLILDCSRRIQEKEILCLRDLEKTLLLIAPERTKGADQYLEYCLTTVRCIQATVEYLTDREQTRPRDLPYTHGYFIDLVDQIRQYATELSDAKRKQTGDEMDVDPTDEVKLHGGIHINGRPAELVRVKKNGKAISLATGEPVEIEEEATGPIRVKRSASEELADEEEIMRSMARRKKNASPEELAPKKCREPGCNKEFKRPCDLTKHEKTHSRPWKCPVSTCKYHDYGWPTEKEMDRHHNDKHSSAPPMYQCRYPPCPYKSKRESNCKQHMEKAHGWSYVRTKTNGGNNKKSGSVADSSVQQTPQLHSMPTPTSESISLGIATPPEDQFGMYNNHDFPAYIPNDQFNIEDGFNFNTLPQEIQLDYSDYSPIDNGTPSTNSDFGGQSVTFQDVATDLITNWDDDIYSANNVQLPSPTFGKHMYDKQMAQQFAAFTAEEELRQPQLAPHISPIGQGNAMLFTPTSLKDVDEGFEDYPVAEGNGADFLLYPPSESKANTGFIPHTLFGEVPSMAGGYSQPNSQDFMATMDWSHIPYSYETQS